MAPHPTPQRTTALRDRPRVLCLAPDDPALRALLADVLSDLGIEIAPLDTGRAADLVLAVIDSRDAQRALALARHRAAGMPVLAVFALADDRKSALAHRGGAAACYALDRPLDELREALRQLLWPWFTRPTDPRR